MMHELASLACWPANGNVAMYIYVCCGMEGNGKADTYRIHMECTAHIKTFIMPDCSKCSEMLLYNAISEGTAAQQKATVA